LGSFHTPLIKEEENAKFVADYRKSTEKTVRRSTSLR
jgi:hypothetical protein